MSLSGAISSAVSALNAQSSALATVSTNLANSSTVGYKSSETSFQSLLAGGTSSASIGGVTTSVKSNLSSQGLLTDSTVSTNMGINGSGMFVVANSENSNELNYTRSGEFSVNSEGYLTSGSNYLQGWPTDADGNVVDGTNSSNLEAIDTSSLSSVASATSDMSLTANLPANAEVGDTFENDLEVYDSLGTSATVGVTWEKTATNTWTATFSDPVSSDGSTIGTVTSSAITLNFDGDGALASTSPASPSLEIDSWTTGATDSGIVLDLGISQLSPTTSSELEVSLTSEQDGMAFGSLTGVSVADDGTVYANYDNDSNVAIYKVAIATFTNVDGLTAMTGGLYDTSSESGTVTYQISNTNGAGQIFGGQLESSTVDTNTEFSRMMEAQQSYSAASQTLSAANDMFDTLMNAIR